jgi:hypothetical protein
MQLDIFEHSFTHNVVYSPLMTFLFLLLTSRSCVLYIMHVITIGQDIMNSTFLSQLIPPPEQLADLNLDDLRQNLESAAAIWAEQEQRIRLYETELQRELRAKIDLSGPIPACPTPEDAFLLNGLALLSARREASQKFNQVFFMAPLSRHAQTPTPTVPLPDAIRPPSSARAYGQSYQSGARG